MMMLCEGLGLTSPQVKQYKTQTYVDNTSVFVFGPLRGPVAQEQDTRTTRSVTAICNGPQKCNGHCRCLQIAFRYNVYISALRIAIKFLLACAYDGVWYHVFYVHKCTVSAQSEYSKYEWK